MTEHPALVQAEGDQDTGEGVDETYFEQSAAGYLDSHTVGN